MDQNLNKSPGLALPNPYPADERAGRGLPPHTNPAVNSSIEQQALVEASHGTTQPSAMAGAGQPTATNSPVVQPPVAIAQPAASTISAADDDADALDKEWISRAKAIVERTKNDPYVESRELGRIKADYLKTRHNKQIKVAEERLQQ